MRVIGKCLVMLAMVAAMSSASVVSADDRGEAALSYRQSLFKSVVWNFMPMNEMARDKRPYDAEEVKKRALAVSYLSLLLSEAFPAGSGSAAGTTDALDAIWKNPEDFAAKLKVFQTEANELRRVAAQGNQESFVAQFKKVGAACKDCHADYKAD